MNEYKIKVCTPYADETEIDPRVMASFSTFLNQPGFKFKFIGLPGPNLIKSRNDLLWGSSLNEPQDKSFDAYLFVDSDTEGTFDDFKMMWDLNEPLVFGAYPYKSERMQHYFIAGMFMTDFPGATHEDLNIPRTTSDVIPVDWAGFGFTLIRAEVLDKIPYPWIEPRTVKAPEFYHRKNESMFDDISFCLKAREHGYKILLDCRLNLKHHKRGKMETQNSQKVPESISEIKDNMDREAVLAIGAVSNMAVRIQFLSETVANYQVRIAENMQKLANLEKKIDKLEFEIEELRETM